MRWRPKLQEPSRWFYWLSMPIWGPLTAVAAISLATLWTKRQLLGPSSRWRLWFAWHPVKIDDDDGWPLYHHVWFEWVERRASHVSADAVYRHPRPLPHQREEGENHG